MKLLIVGPSGSGKSTLEKLIEKELKIPRTISHTSRKRRDYEVEGVNYHYVSKEYFIDNDCDFLEYKEYDGNYYGTHKSSLFDDCIIVAEPEGILEIQNYYKGTNEVVITIYLECCDDIRAHRMMLRGDSSGYIVHRLKQDKEIFKDYKFEAIPVNANKDIEDVLEQVKLICKDYVDVP